MEINVNILISGGLLLFGFLVMVGAAVYDMIDVQVNGPIEDIDPSPDEYKASRPTPGTNMFWIGAAAVGVALFVRYKKWGE